MNYSENISLLPYNSFGIEAYARYFVRFSTLAALTESLDHIRSQGQRPALILGGGSNLLLTGNIHGWVLKNEIRGMQLESEDETYYYVRCQAGENWHAFVQFCIHRDYAGLENLSLIPGNTGAS
ncbi:MAG: FAD-binding protein, partial [Bacteroidota bacterium]|nr:FAD-binding protein [Bacteroidota bacterium]